MLDNVAEANAVGSDGEPVLSTAIRTDDVVEREHLDRDALVFERA